MKTEDESEQTLKICLHDWKGKDEARVEMMRCPGETYLGYLPPRIIENQVRILRRGITLSGLINKEDIPDGSKTESHV